jgi:hypothetical protein
MTASSKREFSDLSCLDDARLAAVFEEQHNDPAFLEALNEELKQRHSDEALNLQIKVVAIRRAFARRATPIEHTARPPHSGDVRDWLSAFFAARNMPRPDGRALYRYRMADSEYEQAKSYQHDDFVALCSELVESLLHLRQEAEADGAGGVRNSALLDVKHPGWRNELPIYVPTEDEALVTELLVGLLDEKMAGLTTEGVEVRRYLVKRDGEWRSALQLLADGEIPSTKLPALSMLSRVRAIATGELGNHLAGEVALLEPPTGEQRRWRVRPYIRAAKLLTDFPSRRTRHRNAEFTGRHPSFMDTAARRSPAFELLVFEPDEARHRTSRCCGCCDRAR